MIRFAATFTDPKTGAEVEFLIEDDIAVSHQRREQMNKRFAEIINFFNTNEYTMEER